MLKMFGANLQLIVLYDAAVFDVNLAGHTL